MEAPGMGDINKSEPHLTSAAAFVEGGIQDACDDACSICLEAFCLSDPSTVTGCKHEFHLQCILEWCQRSSQCPMCWQPISLKDPTSQELLEAVETERNLRLNPARNATIFHHPTLGDFELQHLPVGASDAELEERIIQHLAAAAAMGRARHIARREGQRNRGSSGQGRPQFLVFSTHPNSPAASPTSSSPVANQSGLSGEPVPPFTLAFPSPSNSGEESLQPPQNSFTYPTQVEPESASTSGSRSVVVSPQTVPHLSNRSSPSQSSPSTTQDVPGPSDLQSFSESLKSRFNAVSMRYKESISKSTRGWKERWFARNTSMADLGSEVKREVNAGIATVSRMMERLDTRDTNNNSNNNNNDNNNNNNSNNNNNNNSNDDRTSDASVSSAVDSSIPGSDYRMESRTGNGNSFSETNLKASSCTASSSSD